ncbi:alpha/beta fold hydrolase [Streptomyces morookaense]|uniref:esterase/lipase family protein n=1 Tax=Streptomyces morookaense TaxID=1970 RepID=UPI0033E45996
MRSRGKWRRPHRIVPPALIMATAAMLAFTSTTAASASASASPETGPVQNNWTTAFLYSVAHPQAVPAGVNGPGCRPGKARPRPVVLVNGTLENSYANWSRLAPQLHKDGYCVFGFDYGGTDGSPFQQLGPMRTSGLQLSAFVDKVLATTGASRVDLVGHSQGGLLPLYYINRLGGETKVGRMVGIEPASRGVHLYGLLPLVARIPGMPNVMRLDCAACVDFTAGSSFMRETAEGGYTRPAVEYTTIISRTDGLISASEARLPAAPDVTNVVTQDVCSLDFTDHVNAVYDDITLRIVRNALDPAHAVNPGCHVVPPLLPPQSQGLPRSGPQ